MSNLPRTFAALSDETRLRIVERLMDQGELPAGDLVAEFDISAPAVSRHLKVLRTSGLIRQRVAGTHRYYAAQPEAIKLISDWVIDRRAFWEGSLDRLDRMLALDEGDGK